MIPVDKTINDLLDEEGVASVYVNVTIEPVIKKRNTGKVDDMYQEIRERVLSEEEVEALLPDEMSYSGTIDLLGDFHVKDRAEIYDKYDNE